MKTITISVTPEQLRRICEHLSAELHGNILGAVADDGDFAGILSEWREYAPRYVADEIRDGDDRETAEATRQRNDEGADLLEHLIKHLPAVCAT